MKLFHIYIFILMITLTNNTYSQFAKWVTKKYIIDKDSILVKNEAIFCKHKYYNQTEEQDAVKFTLTVINKSNHLIPDIQTARFNQPAKNTEQIHSGALRIFINGYDAMQLSLANGMFGGDKTLARDSSDTWDWDIQITGEYKADFGDVFTWQWEYMGIKSPIMQVDVKNRTITEVKEHVKSDKVIY